MPDGRFLAKSIAHDWELNSCSLEADFLFSRCIPHLDCEGRLPGHPQQVQGLAVPLRHEFTPELVDTCLGELQEAGLLDWYEVDGRPALYFPGFEANQKGMRKDREAPSKLPSPKSQKAQRITTLLRSYSGPTPDQVRTNSRSTPDLLRPSEVKGSEVKEEYLPSRTPPVAGEAPWDDPGGGSARPPVESPGLQEEENLGAGDGYPDVDGYTEARLRKLEHRAMERVRAIGHRGRDVVTIEGPDGPAQVGMGLERHIWRTELIHRHDPEELCGALEFIDSTEELDVWTLRLLEQRNEVCERALAKFRTAQRSTIRPDLAALTEGIGDGPGGSERRAG